MRPQNGSGSGSGGAPDVIEIAIDEKRYNESIKNKLDTAILTFTSN